MVAQDRVYFLAKDSHWTWIGWSLSAEGRETKALAAGLDPQQAPLTLRVFDLGGGHGPARLSFQDVETRGETDHWYLRLDRSGHTYQAGVGFKAADGTFHAIAESLPLHLPPGGPAEPGDEEWSAPSPGRWVAPGEEKGYLLIVLHAHQPFVRHPERKHALEERWLFEAILESYLPLAGVFSRLAREDARFAVTLSLTPTLLEQLADPLLQGRFLRHTADHARLAAREEERRQDGPTRRLARMYRDRFEAAGELLGGRWSRGLVPVFRELADAGAVEVLASCATHAYLPLWESRPEAVELQVRIGVEHYRRTFGRQPRGFWLPECGFVPGVDEALARSEIRYFFLDAHGILNAKPRPRLGVHAPICCPSGIAAFGRDSRCHDLVWRKEGYPGDPAYISHDRDLGFEIPWQELQETVHSPVAVPTGIRYWSQSADGRTLYDPDLAFQRCDLQASHFVRVCQQRIEELGAALGRRPVLVAMLDAEHFGHWWNEGPQWLDLVLRKLTHDQKTVRLISAAEYLDMGSPHQIAQPAASSWGYQGYHETWLMGRNHWLYPPIFEALEVLEELASAETGAEASRVLLDQYIRELLLAQSSDWAFILHAETAQDYAAARAREHVENLRTLARGIVSGNLDGDWLAAVRERDNLFSALDLAGLYRDILRPFRR
jgi:1,4-alpha-glucan branching enzyme